MVRWQFGFQQTGSAATAGEGLSPVDADDEGELKGMLESGEADNKKEW